MFEFCFRRTDIRLKSTTNTLPLISLLGVFLIEMLVTTVFFISYILVQTIWILSVVFVLSSVVLWRM